MMTAPLVSIVVPCYNHEKYVEGALLSVINQTYRHIQLIVVDDGSTDNTAQVARSFLDKRSPSSLFVHQRNKGAAETINLGLNVSRGKYVNILNSDDFFDPTRIERCVEAAEQYNLKFIYTGVNYVDEADNVVESGEYIRSLRHAEENAKSFPTLGFAFLKNQLAISTGNMFLDRSLICRVGGFRSYSYVHDWDYVLRCLFYTEPFALHDRLYNYRLHDSNSFKSLMNIEGYETYEVMSNALQRLISSYPENWRAPCPQYWPGVFEETIREWNYHVYLPPRFRRNLELGEFLR